MENRPLQEPIRGVADATKFVAKDPTTTHPGHLLNAFPVDGDGALRLNTRAKLVVEFAGAYGSGPVESIESIPRTSGVIGQYDGPATIDTLGSERDSGTFVGQCLILSVDGSVRQLWNDTRATGISAPPAGAGGYGSFACAWDATDTDVGYFDVVAQYTTLTTQAVACSLLNRFDLTIPHDPEDDTFDEAITHQGGCFDAGPLASFPLAASPPDQEAIVGGRMKPIGPYLFTVANRYIYVQRHADLVMVQRVEVPLTSEVQDIEVFEYQGRKFVIVCTTGSTNTDPPVVADTSTSPTEVFGEHWRSALVLYELQYDDAVLETAVDPGGDPLRRILMPQGTQTGDDGYEVHRTFRIAEWSAARPAGRLCYAIIKGDADGIFFIATANQGFNFDGTIAPDGAKPYLSLSRVNLLAAFENVPEPYLNPDDGTTGDYGMTALAGGWESDGLGSYRRPFTWGTRTLYNDVPEIQAGTRDPGGLSQPPTYWALVYHFDSDTLIAAGCRPSATGTTGNVIAIRGATGELRWSRYVGGLVNQGALSINPLTGNVVVGHSRNSDTGVSKMLTELDMTTGDVAREWDIPDDILYNGYITSANYQTLKVGVYAVAVNSLGQALLSIGPYVQDV